MRTKLIQPTEVLYIQRKNVTHLIIGQINILFHENIISLRENISLFRERYTITIFSRTNVMFSWSNEIFSQKKILSRIPTHFLEITRFNAKFPRNNYYFSSMIICCHSYRSIKASQEKKVYFMKFCITSRYCRKISLFRENIL